MAITLRSEKQEELTHEELDGNFVYLKNMIEDLTVRVDDLEMTVASMQGISFDGWDVTDTYGSVYYTVDGTTIKDSYGGTFGVIDIENMQVVDDYGSVIYNIHEAITDTGSRYELRDDYEYVHYLLVDTQVSEPPVY